MGIDVLFRLLKFYSYDINKQRIKERLFSDPDKGVVSITNALEYFNIKNVAATVPKESLNELPPCFIAQVLDRNNNINLVLVNKKNDEIKLGIANASPISVKPNEFITDWTGIIIAIEKNENAKIYSRKRSILNFAIIGCVGLAIFYVGLTSSTFLLPLYFTLSVLGLYISFLVIKEKLNQDGELSKFCTISKNTDCQMVLNSKVSIFFNLVDLADASIVYFSFITIAFLFNPEIVSFKTLSVLSIPIVLYSIYYQYFKIKKWCPLCLSIAGILVFQFLVLIFITEGPTFEFLALIPTSVVLILLIVFWVIIKELLVSNHKNQKAIIENLSFRRNHQLFIPYYNSITKIETNTDAISDIRIGSHYAKIIILIITNPLCEICFEAHYRLMSMQKKYPDNIQLRFRFFVPHDNKEDPRTQITERFLELYFNQNKIFEEAFNHWYSKVSIKEWLNKWGQCRNQNMNAIVSKHHNWCVQNNIDYAPAILINEKLFPNFYAPEDIENFIDQLIEIENLNA